MTTKSDPLAHLETARDEGRTVLLEPEGYTILAAAGMDVPAFRVVRDADAVDSAALDTLSGDAVVLKVVSPDVLHKSDVGGVKVVARTVEAVREGVATVLDRVRTNVPEADLRGVMIVEKIAFVADAPGTELLLSARQDEAFGPMVAVGPGGVLTEWYGKLSKGRSHTILGAGLGKGEFDAERGTQVLKSTAFGAQALRPSRLFSTAPFGEEALQDALRALVSLIERTEDGQPVFEEIELNPVVAVDGRPVALDALIRLATPRKALRPQRPVEKVGALLHPRSAAIYGASANAMNAGRIILRNLKQAQGLDYGRLWAVHPKADRIDGVPCVKSTVDLPQDVDIAVIAIPAEKAAEAIDEIATSGRAKAIILIPGGFAETGEGERAVEVQEILAKSREREDGGPVLVGGNCLGIVSKHEYNTFFLPTYKLPFHDAPGDDLVVVSQSGAYLVTFTSNLDGIVFPRVSISYGNEMDLTASDFFEYYLDHETEPRVFSFYIEGFQPGEGERFLGLVQRARKEGRAVVVYKAGKTAAGAKAAASHTASIAGDYAVARALMTEAGAIVCETLNMFEDTTKVLTMLRDRKARGRRVGVITNAGFEAGAVSDHLYGLEMTTFSDETRRKLEEVLPVIAHCGNPIDCTPMTDTQGYARAVEIMAHADEVDVIVVSAIPAAPTIDILAPDPEGAHTENVFGLASLPAEIKRVFRSTDKPIVATIDSGRLYDPAVLLLERAGVPVYRKIDRASRALSTFVDHHLL